MIRLFHVVCALVLILPSPTRAAQAADSRGDRSVVLTTGAR